MIINSNYLVFLFFWSFLKVWGLHKCQWLWVSLNSWTWIHVHVNRNITPLNRVIFGASGLYIEHQKIINKHNIELQWKRCVAPLVFVRVNEINADKCIFLNLSFRNYFFGFLDFEKLECQLWDHIRWYNLQERGTCSGKIWVHIYIAPSQHLNISYI